MTRRMRGHDTDLRICSYRAARQRQRACLPRQGYVLLAVLITLVLASTLLVQLANRSLEVNQQSLQSARDLQAKWGRISCERLVLPAADQILKAAQITGGPEPGSPSRTERGNQARPRVYQLRQSISLGGQGFELLLADESAKANLNHIGLRTGARELNRVIESLTPPKYVRSLHPGAAQTPPFNGLGSIFNLQSLRQRHGDARVLAEASQWLTIWGSGKLNVHRAPEEVVRAVCSCVIPTGRANRLLETLLDSPAEVEIILQTTIKNESEREALRELLADGSSCFSLWTECRTGLQASKLALAVRVVDEQGLVASHRFLLH